MLKTGTGASLKLQARQGGKVAVTGKETSGAITVQPNNRKGAVRARLHPTKAPGQNHKAMPENMSLQDTQEKKLGHLVQLQALRSHCSCGPRWEGWIYL